MSRGNGKQAKQAIQSGRLGAFVVAKAEPGKAVGAKDWVDWKEIDENKLLNALYWVVATGGALLLGCSRDKLSYSLKLYIDGNGQAYYFPCTDQGVADLEAMLVGLAEAAQADFDEQNIL
jgi:hypothetical protein